ncbi:MAG: acnA [Gammaproteobacteria bacterium]|jgi:aconitate hydratase|nr:acnA [Gammaproteobacteria bacterium]
MSNHSLKTRTKLTVDGETYHYYSLPVAEDQGLQGVSKLPYTLKVLLENLLRFEDGDSVTRKDIEALVDWTRTKTSQHEISFRPARVLMQDFTGVPAVVDLAAMRDAVDKLGSDARKINPIIPVDLVIDHSVQVDVFGNTKAFVENTEIEMQRNEERYEFLAWGQKAFENFSVVPPGTGICHQVNVEYLGKVTWHNEVDGVKTAYPDTLVGTDSHTTMINCLGILGWGVGGIEAEAAMLNQPISMLIPEVIGFKLKGRLPEGVTATDLVLTITQMLRAKGVVGKFVEFYGPGLDTLSLPDRSTISNMAPEYGATCGYFPVDQETIRYLQLTGRNEHTIALAEAYAKAQGLWRDEKSAEPIYTDTLELDLATVEPCVAGPKRPQDRVNLGKVREAFDQFLASNGKEAEKGKAFAAPNNEFAMHHGDVVIAAITSCTNTSNPGVLMAAGLIAKKAVEKGLQVKPWVKTSLAPGSQVVTDYLEKAGLQKYLNDLGFDLVGYGCTTCIGNSGPLPDEVTKTIQDNDLAVSAVLSGNRNFEGRIHPLVKANWLASPPLVVIYALAGTTRIDLTKEPIGKDASGNDVYMKDLWPSNEEVIDAMKDIDAAMFRKRYDNVFYGTEAWRAIKVTGSETYEWKNDSTYIQNPPYFTGMKMQPEALKDIVSANILAVFGDSVTTDHISPAGNIKKDSPAGKYLMEHGVQPKDFNSYGARRGNHEVMMRGTFANIRIRNEMVPGVEGGVTKYLPSNETMSIYDAAMKYQQDGKGLIIIAGKEYGTGSSRDWAAKGPRLLGVKAVIAESFERIHRSNLIGMGILPLEFKDGETRHSLKLDGTETFTIHGLNDLKPSQTVNVEVTRANGSKETIHVKCRIDTNTEMEYFRNGGILQYVLRNLAK